MLDLRTFVVFAEPQLAGIRRLVATHEEAQKRSLRHVQYHANPDVAHNLIRACDRTSNAHVLVLCQEDLPKIPSRTIRYGHQFARILFREQMPSTVIVCDTLGDFQSKDQFPGVFGSIQPDDISSFVRCLLLDPRKSARDFQCALVCILDNGHRSA